MLSKLLPLVFLALGAGVGIASGYLTGHDRAPDKPGIAAAPESDPEPPHGREPETGDAEYTKLNNQFVVPVVTSDRIEALVVVSLSLETDAGLRETVYAREPKLRDAFLRVLFDHANMGGFHGEFTRADRLDPLRTALREVAQAQLGAALRDVLIVDIVRQDS
ncbi:MAG: flagellar basal body-associated FliL family protein [Rhodobacteraceae bacterium]|nr:flagellar basal body-associated FliL family protein [Paracoccaceae bacterium]